MTHHHARLIAVAIAAVSCSTPITAQQEPTSPTTLETLVETLGGRVSQNEQGEVVGVDLFDLFGRKVTDASLAHLTGLTALESLNLDGTQITDAGLVHLAGLMALERLWLDGTQVTDAGVAQLAGLTALEELHLHNTQVTVAGVMELEQALPNCFISFRPPLPIKPF